jgi:ABC-type multidrug transport system fused ATPase/permease subunit
MKSLTRSLFIILPREDLLRMAASSCLLLFVAVAEVLGLGLISFLLINMQRLNEAITLLPLATLTINYFNISAQNVPYVFCILVLVYSVGASVFSVLSIQSISVSSQLIGSRLRARVLKYFLYSDWAEISKIQTSDKVSTLINDGRQVGFLISFCLHLFSRLALASLIVISLLFYNFALSLTMVSILITVYGSIFFLLQPSIYKHGADGAYYLGKTLKVLSNIFGSLKEVMFYGVQEKFIKDYKAADTGLAWAEGSNVYLAQIPRFLIDVIILMLLVVGVIYIYGQGYKDFVFFGTLSVYGLAALKLLPAFQNIYYCYHEIVARQVQLKSMVEVSQSINSRETHVNVDAEIPFLNKIEFKNVAFQYDANSQMALKDINIDISYGKNIAIIGPSGSGKSTFLDLLLGFSHPEHGKIFVDGVSLTQENKEGMRKNFAYVPQKVYLIEDTLMENILFGARSEDSKGGALDNAIKLSRLKGVVEKLPLGLNTVLSESNQLVSGGEKQSIGIARASLKQASVIILDEATNAMDYDLEEVTMQNILSSSEFKTVICITHKPALLKYFDEIYVFDAGTITSSGSYEEIIADSSFLEEMMKDSYKESS